MSGIDTKKEGAEGCSEAYGTLDEWRIAIDRVDHAIIDLLAERQAISRKILAAKLETGALIRDVEREERLLQARLVTGKTVGLAGDFVVRVFQDIIEHSVRTQERAMHGYSSTVEGVVDHSRSLEKTIAVEIGQGDFSKLAAKRFSRTKGVSSRIVSAVDCSAVLAELLAGTANYSLVPIESSSAGVNREVLIHLLKSGYAVVGEVTVPVELVLAARPGVVLSEIREVVCHPEAFNLCSQFMRSMVTSTMRYADGEESAARCAESDSAIAALTTVAEAKAHDLTVIVQSVTDQSAPQLRYFVIAKDTESVPLEVSCKSCIVFKTSQHSGALLAPLEVFMRHGLVLSRLESCGATPGQLTEAFFAEFYGNRDNSEVRSALTELSESVVELHILGTYPVDQFTHASIVREDD